MVDWELERTLEPGVGARSGPPTAPGYLGRIGGRTFVRLKKRAGRRQLLFLPGVVLKLGLDASERRTLAVEAAHSAAAARDPFWAGLPAAPVNIFAGFVGRRFRPVGPGDFPAVARLVEDRLGETAGATQRPIRADLAHCAPALALLDAADRARLERLLDAETLPVTSMHGDLHFFNFVRTGAGFRIIDWEHFEADGSFVYDYVDFHVAVDHMNRSRYWPDTLAALGVDHPAIGRGAAAAGTPPRALRSYYLVRKVATILTRRGAEVSAQERDGLGAAIRRTLALIGLTLGEATPLLALV